MEPLRVVVIGIGGIGSWFVPGLARALEYGAPGSQIILIDGDSYEPSNIKRQQFSGLGNKAQIMRKDIAESFPETIMIAKAAWVVAEGQSTTEPDSEDGTFRLAPSEFLQEGDHVFSLVDNYATRALLFDAGQAFENIDVYTGGNDEELAGSIYHYIRRDGADFSYHPGHFHDEFVNPPDKNPGSMSCEERAKIEGGTQILSANLQVASLLLSKVSWYMLGNEEQKSQSERLIEIHFDMASGRALPVDDCLVNSEQSEEQLQSATV